jgi:serine/threonine protein kinase
MPVQAGELLTDGIRLGEPDPRDPRVARALRLDDRQSGAAFLLELDARSVPSFDPASTKRDEARLRAWLSRPPPVLDHPALEPVWAWGVLEDTRFGWYVTPEPTGGTLDDLLEKGPFDLLHALQTIIAIAEAVQALHEAGFVCVDLRPTVIWTTPGWSRDAIRVPGPWAIGPPAGFALGGYCAPEVGFGDIRPAADQFSLGVMLYELLTGTPPHNPEAPPGDRTQVPILPAPGVPDALVPVLETLLAESPEQRYPDLSVLVALLKEQEAELATNDVTIGTFTPVLPPGRASIPDQLLPRPPRYTASEDDEAYQAARPPTDNVLGVLLVLIAVFGCAMGLSYAVLTMW